jgi:hypothetical protein
MGFLGTRRWMSALGQSAVLTLGRWLPVYPDERTSSEPIGMSQTCQERKSNATKRIDYVNTAALSLAKNFTS